MSPDTIIKLVHFSGMRKECLYISYMSVYSKKVYLWYNCSVKKLFMLLSSLLFLFFSCHKDPQNINKSLDTLRGEIEKKTYGIEWADEKDPEGLPKLEKQDLFLQLPLSLCALPKSGAVFPFYDDFGELNVSGVPASLVKFVNSFCSALCGMPDSRQVNKEAIDSTYPFLKVVLEDEITELHKIDTFYVAKPEFADGVYQIPVRLVGVRKHTDIVMFVNKKDEQYFIEQIYFGESENE